MDHVGSWGGASVSYPTLPPPHPGAAGAGYPADAPRYPAPSFPSSTSSAYPPLPSCPPPVIPSLPYSSSPSAPWIASSPSAASSAPEDFADADVVPYSAGGADPYGARGTGSSSYWSAESGGGSSGQGLVKVQMPQVAPVGPRGGSGNRGGEGGRGTVSESSTVASSSSVQDGVNIFRVKLLSETDSSPPKDVVCKIGLDGVRLNEAESGRLMRIYPLDIITRWEVKEPTVFTFWVRTSVDVDQRAVRLRSNVATTTLILDTLTAACVQVFEMVGKDKTSGDGTGEGKKPGDASGTTSGAGGSSAPPSSNASGGTAGSFMGWMLQSKSSSANATAPAPTVEKHHWVPDEEVTHCSGCYCEFGTFVRRHHCRNCGHVFCDKCSRGRTALTSEVGAPLVRVCDACLAEVTHRLTLEKEKGEEGGVGAPPASAAARNSGAASTSSIPSHEELMRRLEDEMKRSSGVSGPPVSGARKASGTSSFGGSSTRPPPQPLVPPVLSGMPPASVLPHGHGSAGTGGAGSRDAPSGAAWLSTCSFCTAVALVSASDPRCPTCGAQSTPPSATSTPPNLSAAAPQLSHYPAPPAVGDYGGVQQKAPLGPPLWPAGPSPTALSGAPKREVVACPTCTAHLEVQLPAVGTETLQCGVCQHPFVVGTE